MLRQPSLFKTQTPVCRDLREFYPLPPYSKLESTPEVRVDLIHSVREKIFHSQFSQTITAIHYTHFTPCRHCLFIPRGISLPKIKNHFILRKIHQKFIKSFCPAKSLAPFRMSPTPLAFYGAACGTDIGSYNCVFLLASWIISCDHP